MFSNESPVIHVINRNGENPLPPKPSKIVNNNTPILPKVAKSVISFPITKKPSKDIDEPTPKSVLKMTNSQSRSRTPDGKPVAIKLTQKIIISPTIQRIVSNNQLPSNATVDKSISPKASRKIDEKPTVSKLILNSTNVPKVQKAASEIAVSSKPIQLMNEKSLTSPKPARSVALKITNDNSTSLKASPITKPFKKATITSIKSPTTSKVIKESSVPTQQKDERLATIKSDQNSNSSVLQSNPIQSIKKESNIPSSARTPTEKQNTDKPVSLNMVEISKHVEVKPVKSEDSVLAKQPTVTKSMTSNKKSRSLKNSDNDNNKYTTVVLKDENKQLSVKYNTLSTNGIDKSLFLSELVKPSPRKVNSTDALNISAKKSSPQISNQNNLVSSNRNEPDG